MRWIFTRARMTRRAITFIIQKNNKKRDIFEAENKDGQKLFIPKKLNSDKRIKTKLENMHKDINRKCGKLIWN